MQTIGIGMLGAGFIGQMHSLTFGGVHRAKHEPQLRARLIMLAEANQALAQEIQERYDWEGLSQDWRTAVEHPDVEIFVNAGPNDAHAEPNLAATAHGKPGAHRR